MDFKLNDLIHEKNNIVTHLFLHSIDSDFVEKLKITSDEDFNNKTIDIKLLIEGEEYDVRKWLKTFEENYFIYLKNVAKDMLAEKLSKKSVEIQNRLEEIHSKLETLESYVDWDDVLIKK